MEKVKQNTYLIVFLVNMGVSGTLNHHDFMVRDNQQKFEVEKQIHVGKVKRRGHNLIFSSLCYKCY